ncbi:MAG TPA: hypothetical protein VFV66_25475, partial [Nonomuraea sp.]|nr:hypothetical protein [Nonomuraea sp.]
MADVGDKRPSYDAPTTPFRKIVLPAEETVKIPRPAKQSPSQPVPSPPAQQEPQVQRPEPAQGQAQAGPETRPEARPEARP